MKPTELRIGNLMQEHFTGKKIEVIELTKDTIVFSGSFKGKWQAEPIPITKEILLKIGFTQNCSESNLFYLTWDLKSLYRGETLNKSFSVALFDGFYVVCQAQNTHLKYLHQLQNIWQAITLTKLNVSNV